MFARLSQLSRHLSRPLPGYGHITAPTSPSLLGGNIMTSGTSAEEKSKRMIHTAGCIIIGDEVLGGKTVDTNSAYLAKFCFKMGMNLKRVEVIGDDEGEIVEAARRMSDNYDFVVTRQDNMQVAGSNCADRQQWRDRANGTARHDDITYQSIAKAFDLSLVEHEGALQRMKALSKPHPSQPNFSYDVPSAALEAKKRMIRLPIDTSRDDSAQVLFVDKSLWVPISVVNGNVHTLPGVPRLFEKLLEGLKPGLVPRLTDPEGKGVYRLLFSTPMAESAVAGYLTELAAKVEPHGVKVGSYPRWGRKRNSVTLVGKDKAYLDSLIEEVEKNVKGKKVDKEDEMDESDDPDEG